MSHNAGMFTETQLQQLHKLSAPKLAAKVSELGEKKLSIKTIYRIRSDPNYSYTRGTYDAIVAAINAMCAPAVKPTLRTPRAEA